MADINPIHTLFHCRTWQSAIIAIGLQKKGLYYIFTKITQYKTMNHAKKRPFAVELYVMRE